MRRAVGRARGELVELCSRLLQQLRPLACDEVGDERLGRFLAGGLERGGDLAMPSPRELVGETIRGLVEGCEPVQGFGEARELFDDPQRRARLRDPIASARRSPIAGGLVDRLKRLGSNLHELGDAQPLPPGLQLRAILVGRLRACSSRRRRRSVRGTPPVGLRLGHRCLAWDGALARAREAC